MVRTPQDHAIAFDVLGAIDNAAAVATFTRSARMQRESELRGDSFPPVDAESRIARPIGAVRAPTASGQPRDHRWLQQCLDHGLAGRPNCFARSRTCSSGGQGRSLSFFGGECSRLSCIDRILESDWMSYAGLDGEVVRLRTWLAAALG